jgi:glycosyltransferase involved in cell wall biosynthesis
MADGGAPEQTIGVVIRTLNESELIGTCLETLRSQRGSFELDILVVDSGSTDATVEIARAHGSRIVKLSPGDFDYSRSLNLGIDEVRGDLVVSLSAHAIPIDEGWLEAVLAPFERPEVAGVSTRQVPWPDAPWQEVKRLAQAFTEVPRNYSRADAAGLLFSNAASAIRRSVWREHPFTLPAVEDLEWAHRVVEAGWSIVYEPQSAVYHSHRESPRAQARRMIDINRVNDAKRTPVRTLREAAGYLRRDARSIFTLDDPLRRKLAYLAELVRTVCFYVIDFSRSGTTAERRRRDSGLT